MPVPKKRQNKTQKDLRQKRWFKASQLTSQSDVVVTLLSHNCEHGHFRICKQQLVFIPNSLQRFANTMLENWQKQQQALWSIQSLEKPSKMKIPPQHLRDIRNANGDTSDLCAISQHFADGTHTAADLDVTIVDAVSPITNVHPAIFTPLRLRNEWLWRRRLRASLNVRVNWRSSFPGRSSARSRAPRGSVGHWDASHR